MANAVDIYVAYKFIKQLSQPWTEWEAYKLGLIGEKGKKLKDATTAEEKAAYPKWKIMVRNIKRFLELLPFGRTRLVSFASALWLLREETGVQDITILENEFLDYIKTQKLVLESNDIIENINTLEKGRYIHKESGDIIFLKENTDYVAKVFGHSVFNVIDNITERNYTVTLEDLEAF